MRDTFSLLLSSQAFSGIAAAAAHGRAVHAYIIEGENGMGKHSMARLLCAALMCTSTAPPCFACSACRRIFSTEHPDVHFFKSQKKNIPVAEIRALTNSAIETSYEGGKRIFIIEDAQNMTIAAQNCLLKTLEEPEGDAVFILLAHTGEQLLSTVRSRCRRIRLQERSRADILAQLHLLGFTDPDATRAAEACGGNIGRAIEMCKSGPAMENIHRAEHLLELADSGSLSGVCAHLATCKECLPEVLYSLEGLLCTRLEVDPNNTKSLVRLKETQQAQIRIKGNINFGLLTDALARGLVVGENIWQRS